MSHSNPKCSRSFCLSLTLFITLAMAGCKGPNVARSTDRFPQKTGFVQRTVIVDGVAKPVWVFIPPDYSPYKMYPAIVFLHGLFEKGSDGSNVLSGGIGPVIARDPGQWPFITIFPQSDGTWQGTERDDLAMAALDDAEKNYSIDPDHVILAGLSYGGLGVWEIGCRHKDRFAALVPVSGQRETELAEGLVYIPIWAFAAKYDPIVGSDNSKEMCQAIQDRGGHARYTELEGGQHDCWTQAVDESELVTWMLAQHRNPLQASANRGTGRNSTPQISGRLRAIDDAR